MSCTSPPLIVQRIPSRQMSWPKLPCCACCPCPSHEPIMYRSKARDHSLPALGTMRNNAWLSMRPRNLVELFQALTTEAAAALNPPSSRSSIAQDVPLAPVIDRSSNVYVAFVRVPATLGPVGGGAGLA